MNLRCVIDKPRSCSINIAIDEMFFVSGDFVPVFRFYRWTEPSYTIGYFQKYADIKNENKYPVVRRMTAGLAVLHDTDLSYSLIISDDMWKHIYNQEQTYKIVHAEIKKALLGIGIICDNGERAGSKDKDVSCVKTFYKDDLFLRGRKIVGSCQRRRGRKILVEGSIHVKLDDGQINAFANNFFKSFSNEINCAIEINSLSDKEIDAAKFFADSKYKTDEWTGLF